MKFIVLRIINSTFQVEANGAEEAIEMVKADQAENIAATENFQVRQYVGKAPPQPKPTENKP